MILYVNGDSNCYGTELKDKTKAWPELLAHMLGTTLINQAMPGAPNSRTLRLTREFIKQFDHNEKLFVVLATTTWEREEWEYDQKIYNISAGILPESLPEKLQEKFRDWVVNQNDTVRAYKSDSTHKDFLNLHLELSAKNIGHVFFHAVNPFMDGADYKSFDKFDWGKNFLDPYSQDTCYYWHLKNKGFEPTDKYHHQEEAQEYWANFMFQYLKQMQLL